jgi:hypothetical protein
MAPGFHLTPSDRGLSDRGLSVSCVSRPDNLDRFRCSAGKSRKIDDGKTPDAYDACFYFSYILARKP